MSGIVSPLERAFDDGFRAGVEFAVREAVQAGRNIAVQQVNGFTLPESVILREIAMRVWFQAGQEEHWRRSMALAAVDPCVAYRQLLEEFGVDDS